MPGITGVISKNILGNEENTLHIMLNTMLHEPFYNNGSYQNHDLVKEIGETLGREKGIDFYYKDFRKGFRESQEQAKKQNLYRQKYCGCVFSKLEKK